ncbi:MAG: response regulator transcription factor, partial [Candidatus Omnitrophica bacterium]|nr:response regulator transcription factor [Candidatus Omnitrophota bacterium]
TLAGADGYLTKPFLTDECIAAIHLVHAGGIPVSSPAAMALIGPGAREIRAAVPNGRLTDQEKRLLDVLTQGLGDKQIAEKMNLSVYTIESYLKHIYPKLGVHSRTAAALLWLKIRS